MSDDDYLWDRSGARPPDIDRLEQLLVPLAHDAPYEERARWRRPPSPRLAVGVIVVAVAAGVAVWLVNRPKAPPPALACAGGSGFRFVARGGAVACGGREVATGILPIGGVLDTGAHEAELAIADIGTAQLGTNTRVSLDRSATTGHHLSIDHGHLHARVAAPPRLFQVSTKSTDVTDLGCEYTIDVDATGAGTIRVQSGKVELGTSADQIVLAPAGTHAAILAGQRPGLPIVDGASDALEHAVGRYLAGDAEAIDALLAAATPADAITVIDLAVIDAAHRPAIVEKLATLAPPEGFTVADAIDPKVLARWSEEIVSRGELKRPGGKKGP